MKKGEVKRNEMMQNLFGDQSEEVEIDSEHESNPQPNYASLFVKDASKNWRVVGADGGSKLLLKEPSANVVLSDYISSEKWKDVTDIDDHLDDVTKDWLNPAPFN